MKIQYSTNLDELVDATERFTNYSREAKKWMRNEFVLSQIFFAVGLLLLGFLMNAWRNFYFLVGFMSVACLSFYWIYKLIRSRVIKKRLKNFWNEQAGDQISAICEFEVNDEGFIYRFLDAESKYPWSRVTQIHENADDIDILIQGLGIIVLRNHYFESMQQKNELLNFVKEKCPNSK